MKRQWTTDELAEHWTLTYGDDLKRELEDDA